MPLWIAWTACITADQHDLRQPHWVDVSVGDRATCAVRADGTVTCWGDERTAPWIHEVPDHGDAVAVSVGLRHACAIRSSGDLACWGDFGIMGVDDPTATTGPSGLEQPNRSGPYDWVEAGRDQTCGGRDGTWECWAYSVGWLDSAPVDPQSDALSLWAGGCLVLDGALACWGPGVTTPDATGIEVVDVSMGPISGGTADAVCLLDDVGTVWCSDTSASSPDLEEWGTDYATFEVEDQNAGCGLTTDGTLDCFGWVDTALTEIPGGTWSAVSVHDGLACGISVDGHLGCWGAEGSDRFPR